MTVLTISADQSHRTKNPYERALWVVAGVLILGSVPAMMSAQSVLSSPQNGWTDQLSVDIQIAQAVNFVAYSALSGGIILAGMALAIRALAFNLRTADTHRVSAPQTAPQQDPNPAITVPVASDTRRKASVPVDHTPYMRPHSTE
jgi:hypothetical protein